MIHEPDAAEIAALCRTIREQGFVDHYGVVHPPWDDKRFPERQLEPPVEVAVWHELLEDAA